MKAMDIVFLLVISVIVAVTCLLGAEANCQSYDIYNSDLTPDGLYCSIGGIALSYDSTLHQCKYLCLQSANCAAFNHNRTDDKCTFFHNPCPLAHKAPEMEYFVFTKTPTDQCSQWIPYTSNDPLDDRMIASHIGTQMVSRIRYNGNYLIGYQYIPYKQCFTYTTVDDRIVSSGSSAPCERLRIADDCTAFWIPYTAEESLSPRAVTGGRMASGEIAYVVKFDIYEDSSTIWISGYYTEGAPNAVSAYYRIRTSNTMMMLVIL